MAAPSCVFTIARVARMLDEDEAWFEEIALEMEPEDGRLLYAASRIALTFCGEKNSWGDIVPAFIRAKSSIAFWLP